MLQYQPHDDDTVSDAEMEEIVRRLHTIETKTSTADVAEALGVSQELVREMLSDIRGGASRPQLQSVKRISRTKRSRLVTWSLSGLAVLVLLGASIAWMKNHEPHGPLPAYARPAEKFSEASNPPVATAPAAPAR